MSRKSPEGKGKEILEYFLESSSDKVKNNKKLGKKKGLTGKPKAQNESK